MTGLQREIFRGPQRPFAVLDAIACGDLLSNLYASRLPYRCLINSMDGNVAAPYLISLQPNIEFMKWLLEGTWNYNSGIVLLSPLTIDELLQHLQTIANAQFPDNAELWFRFYDPRVLRAFLKSSTPEDLEAFFANAIQTLLLPDQDAVTFHRLDWIDGNLTSKRLPCAE